MSFVEIDMQIYAGPYVKYIGIRSKMQNEAMTFVLTLHCDIASYRRWIGYSKLYTCTQAHGMEGHPLQGIVEVLKSRKIMTDGRNILQMVEIS